VKMDFSSNLLEFGTGTYTVTRTLPRALVRGVAQAPSTSTFSVAASVQPATGRDVAVLPEGLNLTDVIQIFTAVELKVAGDGCEDDAITYRGARYEVKHVERYDEIGNYYRALAVAT
jgi:hypothetical protein